MLHAWDTDTAEGWFEGTVHSRGVTARDLKKTPTANFVVKYYPKATDKKLNGLVSCELSARTHGVGEWWVLIERV